MCPTRHQLLETLLSTIFLYCLLYFFGVGGSKKNIYYYSYILICSVAHSGLFFSLLFHLLLRFFILLFKFLKIFLIIIFISFIYFCLYIGLLRFCGDFFVLFAWLFSLLFFSCCSYYLIYLNLFYILLFNFAFLLFSFLFISPCLSVCFVLFALFPSWQSGFVLFSGLCFG